MSSRRIAVVVLVAAMAIASCQGPDLSGLYELTIRPPYPAEWVSEFNETEGCAGRYTGRVLAAPMDSAIDSVVVVLRNAIDESARESWHINGRFVKVTEYDTRRPDVMRHSFLHGLQGYYSNLDPTSNDANGWHGQIFYVGCRGYVYLP